MNLAPAYNADAEASVLGAMLTSRDAIADAVELVNSGDFFDPANGKTFAAITALFTKGEPVDAITVAEELKRRDELESMGGKLRLLELLDSFSSVSATSKYARIVQENALLRKLQVVGGEIQELASSNPKDIPAAVDKAESLVYNVVDRRLRDDIRPIGELISDSFVQLDERQAGGGVVGITSGFDELDELIAGFRPGTFSIVAARPSQGKSALLGDFAKAGAKQEPVAIFSLEMGRDELVQRFLAAEAKVSSHAIRKGLLNDADWAKLSAAAGTVAELPIFIDDSTNVSMTDIRAKCRRIKSRHGLGLVLIDYIQLMQGPTGENRQQEVSDISRNLKLLAREMQVPVIVAAQLNRGLEYRKDKRPMLADLRESGSLEQDTDLVMFIYRAGLYDVNASADDTDLIIAKQRNGPTGTIHLKFQSQYTRFVSTKKGVA